MEARQRWDSLQAHLTAARTACDAGDRDRALEHVDAALAIDPSFLAAHWLRERVLAPPEPAGPPLTTEHGPSAPPAPVLSGMVVKPPLFSIEGYGRFEQRARQRRVDRRIDAARTAIERGRLKDAAAALDEVIELDPDLPELGDLTAEFDELRRTVASTRRGPWLVAVTVFVIGMLGLWSSQDSAPSLSHARVGSAAVEAPPTPVVSVTVSDAVAVATTGEREQPAEAPPREREQPAEAQPPAPLAGRVSRPQAVDPLISRAEPVERRIDRAEPVERRIGRAEPVERRIGRAEPVETQNRISRAEPVEAGISRAAPIVVHEPAAMVRTPAAIDLPVVDVPVAPLLTVAAPPPAIRPPVREAPVTPPLAVAAPPLQRPPAPADDELLITQTLQRYRRAYEGLDAQSAQAVYPAVNQAALARAFDGLHSQTIAFDACDMHVRGGSATATCRGSARYVPKIGSREPRTEPRVWSFTLRKNDGDWKIENARAER